MQELQSHIERINREKMALEATVVELSSYKNEVASLRSDMSKIQVSDRGCYDSNKISKMFFFISTGQPRPRTK